MINQQLNSLLYAVTLPFIHNLAWKTDIAPGDLLQHTVMKNSLVSLLWRPMLWIYNHSIQIYTKISRRSINLICRLPRLSQPEQAAAFQCRGGNGPVWMLIIKNGPVNSKRITCLANAYFHHEDAYPGRSISKQQPPELKDVANKKMPPKKLQFLIRPHEADSKTVLNAIDSNV